MAEMFCEKCQYSSLSSTFCLLGRNVYCCDSREARRGDERLVERFRTIRVKEFQTSVAPQDQQET